MPNYSKSKIYKIVCNITGETYYGSTTQPLSVRIGEHRKDAKKEVGVATSKQIILRGNYDIVLCEECPCVNKEQLHARERKWIEENDCINKIIPGRTDKERYEANKEQIKQYKEEYYEANKEQIKQKKKECYESNKEQIKQKTKEYREANKEQINQYYEEYYKANKEQYKQYYESNKEQIKQKQKEYRAAKKAAKTEELTYEQMIDKMSELHKRCDEMINKLDNLAQ